ncbi:HNH endonuclease [Candidatus Halocynthiibacter alkanivorans]|uniref:HNH endonuclease n=1 Tax=Candidatus Halocynthiibacter alkanivorans TaxID=2267619 RepID=UPI00109C30FF|nr:HNH endonuclease [Candidatus Halocynthiibacter alkanivorans]
MGRLKGRGIPTSRLGRAPGARFGAGPNQCKAGAGNDMQEVPKPKPKRRYRPEPWRKLYASARWKALRQEILLRDGWICQQTGVALIGRSPAANSPVIDHKIPHRGDLDLFWDIDNLQAVAKHWHDSEKQRQERAGEFD